MPPDYFIAVIGFLRDIDAVPLGKDIIIQQCLYTSLQELREILTREVYLSSFKHTKTLSRTFPASYGLNFFGLFYGCEFDGFQRVAINEMNRQLEEQLFIKGNYKLNYYVSPREN